MQPFDPDHPFHGVIVARESLECHEPVEYEYYTSNKPSATWFDAFLCAYCAGTNGTQGDVDMTLSREYRTVLPVCKVCKDAGALPLARNKKKLGTARVTRDETQQLREAREATRQPHQHLMLPTLHKTVGGQLLSNL